MTEMGTVVTELNSGDVAGKSCVVKDIYLAALLHSLEYKLVYARSDGFQAEFHFDDVPSSVIVSYYNGDNTGISARKLFDSFQSMRKVSRQIRNIADGSAMEVPADNL